MLLTTSFTGASPHSISLVAVAAPSVLKSICKMGMMAAKENMFNTAERILNSTESAR